MAERRMFSKTIIDSDAFLDMSASAQALYFHLGVRARDGGVVNNVYTTAKSIRATSLEVFDLVNRGFIKELGNQEFLITHWDENNGIAATAQKRLSYKYRKWREYVLERDGGRCRVCGSKESVMNAHHILPFSKYPEDRYNVANGLTLCPHCHKALHRKERENG